MEQAERVTACQIEGAQHPASAFAAVANVVIDPAAWARDIAQRPKWAVAFVGVVVVRFAGLLAFYGPSVSPGRVVAGVVFQAVTIAPALVGFAFLLWVAALVCNTRLSWPVAFAITTHIYFAHALMTTVIASAAGAFLPSTVDIELRAPPFTNFGDLVSADSALLNAIVRVFDIRSVYAAMLATVAVRGAVAMAGWRRAWRAPATCFAVVLLLATIGAGRV